MEEQVTDIRETLGIIWRRRGLIVAVILAVTFGAMLLSAGKPKTYVARSRLVVRPVVQQQGFSPTGGRATTIGNDISIESQAEILGSPVVAEMVGEALGLATPPAALARSIKVRVVTEELLEISSASQSPQHAASLANTFAAEFISFRQEAARQTLREIATDIENQLSGIDERIDPLDERIIGLKVEIVRLQTTQSPSVSRASKVATIQAEIDRLEAERNELVVQRGILRVRREEVRANELGTIGGGQVVEPATIPNKAASPNPRRDGVVGFILGLILGIIVAFIRERFDDRVRGQADVARVTNVPVLGAVPRHSGRRNKEPGVAMIHAPGSPTAEAYRSLRQTLAARGVGRSVKTVMVTSGGRGAGKSAVVANLAVAFAHAGYRVVAVCGDLRRPTLHASFDVAAEPGFSDVLQGSDAAALSRETGVAGLRVLPSGHSPEDPAPLLDGRRLEQALDDLKAVADVVLIDVPALAAGADALVVASRADLSLLVIRQESARLGGVGAAVDALRHAGASSIAGVMLLAGKAARPSNALGSFALAPADAAPHTNGHAPSPEPAAASVAASTNGNGRAVSTPKRRPSASRAKKTAQAEVEKAPKADPVE